MAVVRFWGGAISCTNYPSRRRQDSVGGTKEYGIFAAPVAFLIGEDGVIARDVAKGVEEIVALARDGPAAG
jgi:hypothetical protein